MKNKILKEILGILFAMSSALLSFHLMVSYEIELVVITGIVSFVVALYFYNKTITDFIEYVKNNKVFSIFSMIVSFIIIMQLYIDKSPLYKDKIGISLINPFRLRFFIISSISALYIGTILIRKIKEFIVEFYKSFSDWDKKIYVILSAISLIIIIFAYSANSNWFMQYDKVYSIDSGWVYKNIFKSSTYYDIRHPIMGVLTFPIYSLVNSIVSFAFNAELGSTINAIVLQFMNVQLMMIIGFLIKDITKNKMIFIIYMISFPTILYSMFFEKYQLCVFLLFLYVYNMCKKSEKSPINIILAAGCMPTSCCIGVLELITSDKFMVKIKKILKIIFMTIIIFVVLGRARVLEFGIDEMLTKKNTFSNKTYSIQEKGISTTKMIQSCFIALPSHAENDVYWWDSIESNISILSLVIIGIIIIGAIINWKSFFVKSCSIWSIFSIVLFVVLNWSTQESPLFNIYFHWALIPLFVMGLDYLINKLKVNRRVVYGVICFIMLSINLVSIIEVGKFLTVL